MSEFFWYIVLFSIFVGLALPMPDTATMMVEDMKRLRRTDEALRRVENLTIAAMVADHARVGRNPSSSNTPEGLVKCSYCSCMNTESRNCQSCGGPLDWSRPKFRLRPARPVSVRG